MNNFNVILYGLKNWCKLCKRPKDKHFFDYISHAQVLRDHPNFNCLVAIDPKADDMKEQADLWSIPVV